MIVYANSTSKKTRRQRAKQQRLWEEQQSRVGQINITSTRQSLQPMRVQMLREGANDFKNVQSIKTNRYDTFKPKDKVYTGTNVIGIAVQHKSCLQPIFNQESAKDSAAMRR
jgi:hypothetical protein